MLDPGEEFIHRTYPATSAKSWKENWYFNVIDTKSGVWGITHFSLQRHLNVATITSLFSVAGSVQAYINTFPIDAALDKLDDGALALEVIEPFKRHRLRLRAPQWEFDLEFRARFAPYLYDRAAEGWKLEHDSLAIEHYEQAMRVTGEVRVDGQSHKVDGLAYRDHSWGHRDESQLRGWNWVCAMFDDRTVNASIIRFADGSTRTAGFVSTADGNVPLVEATVLEQTKNEAGVPQQTSLRLADASGSTFVLRASRFGGFEVPMRDDRSVVIFENFSDYTLDEKIHGVGIDENLVAFSR